MTGKLRILGAFLIALGATPLMAQDDTTAPTSTDTTQPAAAPGETEETIKSVHKDWEVRCRGDNDCFLYQLLSNSSGAPIAEMNVVALTGQDAAAGVTVVSPLRTLLPEGLTFQIDEGRLQQYPFLFCAPVGCASRFGFDQNGLSQLKRGNVARVTIRSVDRPDAPVILDVSLAGFTAGFDALAAK